MLTLVCEHLFSTLRSKTEMPDFLQVARLFSAVIYEQLKKTSINCGFAYHTHRRTPYSAPEGHATISLGEHAQLSAPKLLNLSPSDRKIMRAWRIDHGQKVRQCTVRSVSTKDKPGTLPIVMYKNYSVPDPTPVDIATLSASVCFEERNDTNDNVYVAVTISDHRPFGIVLCETSTEDNIIGQLYTLKTPHSQTVFCSSDKKVTVRNEDVLHSMSVQDFEMIGKELTIKESVLEVLLEKSCFRHEIEQVEESSDDSSDDEVVNIPTAVTRSGRHVKFNTAFQDFIA